MPAGPMMSSKSPVYSAWRNNTHESWWKDPGLKKCVMLCMVLNLGFFIGGYDGSYLNGLQALPTWNEYFNSPAGQTLGLISASAYLPNIILAPMTPLATDRFGRRVTIWASCLLTVAGAIVGCFARKGLGMLIAGRVLVGASQCFTINATICLLSEISHPRLRGTLSGLYLCTYHLGSIVASWTTFGCVYWNSNWGWRIPTLVQAVGPIILIVVCLTVMPESPRWLVSVGRDAEALKILEDLHANGAQDDELVTNEYEEIKTALKIDQDAGNVKWSSFLATKGNRKRILVLMIIGTGSQMLGNNIISYYLAPVLRTVGINNSVQIAGINGGLAVFNFLLSVGGALNMDRIGRRPLWLTSTLGCLISYVFITALSATFAKGGSTQVGSAVVAFLFIFYGFYDIGWTPLVYSYSVEILPFGIRAKGMGFMTFTQNLSLVFCQYVNPIALQKIGWKYYALYIPVILFYLTCAYFLFIETKGYTAEEVALLFDQDKNDQNIIEQLGTGEKGHEGKIEMLESVSGSV